MGGNDSEIRRGAEWVIDTTVLSAFALAEELNVLERHCQGRAAWTTVVYSEILNGVSEEPRLGSVLVAEWLDEPEPIFQVERVESLRLRLGGRQHDEKHLGEATSIVLAQQLDAGILVDDRDAKRLAESQGLRTGTTISALKRVIDDGLFSPEQAVTMLDELIDRYGRRLPRLSLADFTA